MAKKPDTAKDIKSDAKTYEAGKASTDFKDTKDKDKTGEIKGFTRAVPVILCAAALFITLCFITGETGDFGRFISSLFMGLFSYAAYTIPAFIVIHAVFLFSDIKKKRLLSRAIMSVVALITLAEIAYIIPNISAELTFDAAKFYTDGTNGIGGGFIGSAVGYAIYKILGKIGLIITIILTFCLYGIFCFAGKGEVVYAAILKKLASVANFFAKIEEKKTENKKKEKEAKEEKRRLADDKKNAAFFDDDYFDTANGISQLEIPELGIYESKTHAKAESFIHPSESVSSIEKESAEKDGSGVSHSYREEPVFEKTDAKSDGYRSDDIIFEVRERKDGAYSAPFADNSAEKVFTFDERDTRSPYDEDSADKFFSGSFDPYDIALNEKNANKKSSRADEVASARRSFTEDISELTPEYVEKMRRLAEFEARKQEALMRKAAREAAEAKAAEASSLEKEEVSYSAKERSETPYSPRFRAEEKTEETRKEEVLHDNEPYSYSAYSEKGAPSHFDEKAHTYTGISEVTSSYEEYKKDVADAKSNAPRDFGFVGDTATVTAESAAVCAEEMADYTVAREEKIHGRPLAAEEKASSFATYSATENRNSGFTAEVTEKNATVNFEAERKTVDFSVEPSVSEKHSEPETMVTDKEDGKTEKEILTEEKLSAPPYTEADVETSRITVNRTSIEPELSSNLGLDFSVDEEEDFGEGEPEEIVTPKEIPPEERNEKINDYRRMFTIFDGKKEEADDTADGVRMSDIHVAEEDEFGTEEDASGVDKFNDSAITQDLDLNEDGISDESDTEFYEEDDIEDFDGEDGIDKNADIPFEIDEPVIHKKNRPDYSSYKFPPLDFLKKGVVENSEEINDEIQLNGEILLNTLESFNIKATIRGIERGPRITRYSVVPAKGVRVNQIEKLSDDMALALAAESIRIEAPIPGKSAVGIEVPNKISSIVSLRDLLEDEEFINSNSKTRVCIGKSVEGAHVFGDIGEMPHLLIAGATGMGKSVCINALITSILYKARPDEVKFIMIDPKKVEFAPYDGIPHLLVPVVTETKQAAGVLLWAVDEMNKRYDIIQKLFVKNIDSYNDKVKLHPELGEPMSKIIIFIDELNDLMIQVRDPVENLIMLIAQKARAAGIHLVIGTQRPSVNVITGVIKANIPSRIACKVSSGVDSRTILEQIGAEKLIGKGDMLFAPGGKPNPKRVQGAYVSETETENIVNFIKNQVKGVIYDEEIMEDMRRAAQKCDRNKNNSSQDEDYDEGDADNAGFLHDRKFLAAVEQAIKRRSVATSFLQRKLRIGYSKAAQYIDIMEDLGIVGPKDGSKPRDVLISMEEWLEKLSRLTDDD